MNKTFFIAGAIFGLLTVCFGAFGAHALKDLLAFNSTTDVFETAVLYQAIHAVALLVVGMLSQKIKPRLLRFSGYSMIAGVIVFCGSLFLLSITNVKILGAVAPIGGTLMILGWVFLIIGIFRSEELTNR